MAIKLFVFSILLSLQLAVAAPALLPRDTASTTVFQIDSAELSLVTFDSLFSLASGGSGNDSNILTSLLGGIGSHSKAKSKKRDLVSDASNQVSNAVDQSTSILNELLGNNGVNPTLTFTYTQPGNGSHGNVTCLSAGWAASVQLSCFPPANDRNVTMTMEKFIQNPNDKTKYTGGKTNIVISENGGGTNGTWTIADWFDPKIFKCTTPPQALQLVPETCTQLPGVKGHAVTVPTT